MTNRERHSAVRNLVAQMCGPSLKFLLGLAEMLIMRPLGCLFDNNGGVLKIVAPQTIGFLLDLIEILSQSGVATILRSTF